MYGDLVRRARRARGLTQSELAANAGVEQANISAIENERRLPSAATLHRLLHACGFELVASAGRHQVACGPPQGDDDGPAPSCDEPTDLTIDTRRRQLVAALDAAEAIVRARTA
jgi:transcriptional regulator with XRE-family HTH domain